VLITSAKIGVWGGHTHLGT